MENEELKQTAPAAEPTKQMAYGYTVVRNTDGSVDVSALEADGKKTIEDPTHIYEDIVTLSDLYKENKESTLVTVAVLRALQEELASRIIYQAAYYAAKQALADHDAAAAEAATPTVEK